MSDSGSVLIEAHYFPCLAYFAALQPHSQVVLEAFENYPKKTYRNRCQVLAANKVVSLSVPVTKTGAKQLMKDVRIDYRENWPKDHWRTVVSAYGKAPFFSELAPAFEAIFQKKTPFLLDLNVESLTICLSLLGWSKAISLSEWYLEPSISPTDLRDAIHPKQPEGWARFYRPVPYPQNFGEQFVSNLSVLDVLFCQGPYAGQIIAQSVAR
ncbi:MAG: WbqC family protein [Cytophagales bacterium]|nr:WbqC family protein [Cytophagales bacterium]